MALTSGERLGPYRILAALGTGGMGEVYRAHDPRLERDVAIKVMRDGKTATARSRERFEREARAVAALSHPNILAIHDVGDSGERIYAVMELLDGETLRARLERGPLPWRKAVEIESNITDGLAAAHAKGIVHRDLKPANVFLTGDGQVKVLDFGLATLREPTSADSQNSLTLSQTGPGAVLGTVAYMSPEQVAGKPADARSDLFAAGCVLHEMVTGQRTFARGTPAETMAAILNDDAPELVAGTPFELHRLIEHCLEKDPDVRFQSARDLSFHLRTLLESAASSHVSASSARGQTNRRRWVRLAGGAAAVTALVLLGLWLRPVRTPAPPTAVQSYLWPPDGAVVAAPAAVPFVAGPVAISPDGQQLVLAASQSGGKSSLWVLRLDSLAPRKLAGTEDASGPFWKPDGRFIGFVAGGQIKAIAVSGGPPWTLCETKTPSLSFPGGDWSPTDEILFGQYARPLLRLPSSGGPPVAATEMDRARGDTNHCCPSFLPDGRHFLYFVSATAPGRTGVYLGSLDSKSSTFLVQSTTKAVYAAPGHLIFRRRDVLMAAPFDVRRLSVTGEPIPITDRGSDFSVSSTGVLVYAAGTARKQLVWLDRKGNEIEELPIRGIFRYRRLSHDGRRLAAAVSDPLTGSTDIWVYDLVSHMGTRLTSDPADEIGPVWSPGDDRIVFSSNRTGRFDVYETASDGTGHEELLYRSDTSKGVGSWSEDARYLIFNTDGEADGELWSLSLPERRPTLLLRTPFLLWDGQISPDGHFVAYMSSDTEGRHEVYVQPFPSGKKFRLSAGGGHWPRWRSAWNELFFIDDGTRTLRAVNVSTAGVGIPRALFSVPVSSSDLWFNTADGQRFLFAKDIREGSREALTLVQNWPALLKQ